MFIDAHTHIGRNKHINSSVYDLLKSMDKAGIDKSLVFAGMLNDCSNEYLLEQIAPHKDRLLGVAAATLDSSYLPVERRTMGEVQNEVKRIVDWYGEGKVVACKFYTGYEHFYPSGRLIEEYLLEFDDVGCPAIFHMGDCLNSVKKAKLKYAQPLDIDEVAVDFPKMNFIIAHMAFPWHRDAAQVCYKNDNVYADISGFVYGDFSAEDESKFKKTLKEFIEISGGDDKILFGTDFPISNQYSYVNVMRYQNILTNKVFEDNAKKAFRI